jgi:hypothetical protein
MDTDEDMALLVVKEQLTHFRVKMVTADEYEDLLTWWRAQEKHFSYVRFVVRKILGIVGSQTEAKTVFNIVSVCMNLCCSRLGMENLEMLINIYKNWLKDARVRGFLSMYKFMEMEKALMDKNE